MRYLTGLFLLILLYSSCKSTRVENTYQLDQFRAEQLEAGIDSIWMEVASWDVDTSAVASAKRAQYAADLESYFFRQEKTNLSNKAVAEKALLFSYFIRLRNKEEDRIISSFNALSEQLNVELWQAIYPIYVKSLKRSEEKDWFNKLDVFVASTTNLMKKASIWLDLGRYFFYKKDRQLAQKYFTSIIQQDTSFATGNVPKQWSNATSFLNQINKLQVGLKAPSFCVFDTKNEERCVSATSGKVVLLDFWATWCGPCIKDLPKLKSIYEKYKDNDDFQIIGISLDETLEDMQQFIKKKEIPWPQIFEGGDHKRKGEITLLYNGTSLPTYYVIGKDGTIHYNYDSKGKGEDLAATISLLLDQ